MAAVSSGVLTPLPRMAYRYGVLENKPTSVKLRVATVAMGMPDRSTSYDALAGPSQFSVMVLGVVAATRRLLGAPGAGSGAVVVAAGGWPAGGVLAGGGAEPMVAVSTAVVTPPPLIEYGYGVFGSRPTSVKLVPSTVAIRWPERSTSYLPPADPFQPIVMVLSVVPVTCRFDGAPAGGLVAGGPVVAGGAVVTGGAGVVGGAVVGGGGGAVVGWLVGGGGVPWPAAYFTST
jgi:hypothetical protein